MDYRYLLLLVVASTVNAILDGTKVFKETRTKFKRSAQRFSLPSGLLNQMKTNGGYLASSTIRTKRHDENCGFDSSNELEISPV